MELLTQVAVVVDVDVSNGGSGGSGVVIIRATIQAALGSPTYTTSGSYHIYQFTRWLIAHFAKLDESELCNRRSCGHE
jgi:hypothetical protein